MIRQENLTLKDTLTFGRYKGKTIDWIRGFDVQYLIWAEREGIITFHPKKKGVYQMIILNINVIIIVIIMTVDMMKMMQNWISVQA